MTSDLVITKIPRLEDLGAEAWNALVASCPDATCFQAFEWISCWWKVFKPNNEPCLYTAYRDGMLVGLAPMYLESKILQFIGEGHSDYNIFIWHKSERHTVERLLNKILESNEADVVQFSEVPETSELANVLRNRQDSRLRRLNSTPCPKLTRTEENIKNALQKKSIKRKRKKLKELGEICVAHLSKPEDITPYLDIFFRQHIERWSRTDYPSLFLNNSNKQFYEALVVSGLPIVFTVLKVNEKLVASHFGMLSAGDLIWYKPAFDIQLGSYSPGEVLLAKLIEYVNTNSLSGLDFTRGNEAFKLRFCSEVNSNLNYRYYYSEPYIHDIVSLIKSLIKKLLPNK